jgi:hypothetical protein
MCKAILSSRLLKKPPAARCCVENRLEMLTYYRVRCASEPIFALHRIHWRLFQQPARQLAALAVALLVSVGAQGHHSFAVHFVADRIVTVEGVVTEFRFRNPHGIVRFEATTEDGGVTEWQAETNSPNILRRRGWSEASVHVGDEVRIEGYPARDGSQYLRISRIVFADGRELIGQRPSSSSAQDRD